jgi:YD repeat-containing protein
MKTKYVYDAANRLIKVTDWANRVTSYVYVYDKNNNLIKTRRPDGSVLTENYDAAERLTAMKDVDQSGNIIYRAAYTYNANGQTTSYTTISSMTYDPLNRLLSRNSVDIAGQSSGNYDYTYDSSGNITSSSSNGAMSYDKNNRLITYKGTSINYDTDGNMTNGLLKGVNSNFVYDSENRLVQAG